ncbi:DUF3465 domain-containing protein [Neisseriaceae bacterium ESL0693]|nr:DUF3465 domain-containing protein [Neisseriaceae bacterium ESL0693]
MGAWVKKIVLLIVIVSGFWYWQHQQFDHSFDKSQTRAQIEQALQTAKNSITRPAPSTSSAGLTIRQAHQQGLDKVIVNDSGAVVRILPDDIQGDRHQKFIVRTDGGTVLIVHNIDMAPRLPDLRIGDRVGFQGEFIQNSKGGLVHWTHCGVRKCRGWLEYKGKRYQ